MTFQSFGPLDSRGSGPLEVYTPKPRATIHCNTGRSIPLGWASHYYMQGNKVQNCNRESFTTVPRKDPVVWPIGDDGEVILQGEEMHDDALAIQPGHGRQLLYASASHPPLEKVSPRPLGDTDALGDQNDKAGGWHSGGILQDSLS